MKNTFRSSALIVLLLACVVRGAGEPVAAQDRTPAARINWNERAPWGATRRDGTRGPRVPFKMFDNLYSVGLETVSAYLVTTSAGLVLIDSTWADTANMVVDNVRALGFNPADIEYVFVTHGHDDHAGGARRIREVSGARIGMGSQDWGSDERDLVLADNSTISVGDTSFTFYLTPGHTPGATSVAFEVRDGGRALRAIAPGGLGIAFGPDQNQTFIRGVERLKALGPWDVVLGNHPWLMPTTLDVIQQRLQSRGQAPHPAVSGAVRTNEWFDAILATVREKAALEQRTQ